LSIVALIPARGGSKGIPRKNLALLGGRPLLHYTAAAALQSRCIDRVLLSTDDAEIAEAGRAAGLEVPFVRPADIAGDRSPMIAVLRHALAWLEDATGTPPEAFVLLQPTSPLRTAAHIDAAVQLLRERDAETVVSVVAVPHQFSPVSVLTMDDGRLTPFLPGPPITSRQDKPPVFARNGPAVLVVRPRVVTRGELYGEPTLGYVMSARDSIDIDTPEDLEMCEVLLGGRIPQ